MNYKFINISNSVIYFKIYILISDFVNSSCLSLIKRIFSIWEDEVLVQKMLFCMQKLLNNQVALLMVKYSCSIQYWETIAFA